VYGTAARLSNITTDSRQQKIRDYIEWWSYLLGHSLGRDTSDRRRGLHLGGDSACHEKVFVLENVYAGEWQGGMAGLSDRLLAAGELRRQTYRFRAGG
jgi:hypothetical protein